MGLTRSSRGRTLVTSNTLCEFCDSIKFGALGIHGHDNAKFVHARFYKEVLGEWMNGRERHLEEILDGEDDCFFCGKVAEYFREWSSQMFKEEDPPIQNSLAYFKFHRVLCKPKGLFLRFWVTIDVPKPSTMGGRYRSVMQFQKCNQQPLKVEDFCKDFCHGESLFDWEKNGLEQAYCGRFRPLLVDTRLFCKWKETCVEKHDSCISSFTGKRPSWLRLIDVEQRCVVDIDIKDDSNYAVLSYVWGKYKLVQCQKLMPELGKSTENRFRQPKSLTRETVLSTIDDAIEVAQSLGEKYLWVDCLCIMQDDEVDKGKFIPQMDLIYGFASVTIVAASGVDADAGLPGVRRDSRTRKQMPFQIKGVSLLQTLDQEWEERGRGYQYLGDSIWCKRGWTLQEKIFSQRALIFTPEQVYWECQKSTWCEDGVWETEKSPTAYRHCFGDLNNFRRPWSLDEDNFSKSSDLYQKLVGEYSGRILTENSDGFDAFAGILSALEKEAGQHYLWALPTSFLGDALLWEYHGSCKRRLDFRTVRFSDGRIIKCHFPSWSWLGWVGTVQYEGIIRFKVNLIFYYLDDNGTLVQAPGERNDDTRTKVTRENIPESVTRKDNPLNIASNILFFWSDTAELHVRHGVNEFGHDQPFLSRNGEDLCHLLWTHQPVPDLGQNELAEFVVIGKNTDFELAEFIVLLIGWEEGVAYRRGLAKIQISAWEKLDNRVWKMISLG